jgi:hypothetical protein
MSAKNLDAAPLRAAVEAPRRTMKAGLSIREHVFSIREGQEAATECCKQCRRLTARAPLLSCATASAAPYRPRRAAAEAVALAVSRGITDVAQR